MLLSKQCCTVSQGKRLTELGVNAPSHFTHTIVPDGSVITTTETGLHREYEHYPAYTVAELGAMFGRDTVAAQRLYDAVLDRMNEGMSFTIAYSAEFLATCLIGAIERNLITPKQCATNLNH
jgi:hypothetical protein